MDKPTAIARNPLTMIAIFAGVIEASAMASLPFLDENSQNIYTWFLVGFPPFLTILFFLTLNFNYKSLYSPSDFSNENHFLNALEQPPCPADLAITLNASHNARLLDLMSQQTTTEKIKSILSNKIAITFETKGRIYIVNGYLFSSQPELVLLLLQLLQTTASAAKVDPPEQSLVVLILINESRRTLIENALNDVMTLASENTENNCLFALYNLDSLKLSQINTPTDI